MLAADDTTYLTGTSQHWSFIATKSFLGSADKSIKIWNGHKVVKTLTGHTEAVRGLTFLPGSGFASCSNDRFLLFTRFLEAARLTVLQ